jgi:hypothetical protein
VTRSLPLLFQTTDRARRKQRENLQYARDHFADHDTHLFAYGQQTGEVTGTVTDATGALVAEANDPRNLATFGVITSAGPMRQLQFALKYSF